MPGADRRDTRVRLEFELEIGRPPAEVWSVVKDLPRFACIDPFHRRVRVLGPALVPGVRLAIEHGLPGLTFTRVGKLLAWREGQGYVFSDLSVRGPGRGFPHVFRIEVMPSRTGSPDRSRLRVQVRGRWTATWLPRWVRELWLHVVSAAHAHLLRAAFRERPR
jgi:hypothetical protein